nr:alpha/beta hydrolase [Micromonospora sp. DSM 115978]
SPGAHSEPIYQSISQAEKAYLELEGGGHFTVTSPNTTMARTMISWLKRFVDNDARYTQFLCPGPSAGLAVSEFRNTCPM